MQQLSLPPAQAVLHDLKVLIVDDQIETRILVRDILRRMGIRDTIEVQGGKEAFHLLANGLVVDLIISDWNMPSITGLDLLRIVKNVYPRLPFLMLTCRNDMESIIMARKSGVNGYIRIPFTQQELERKIKTVCPAPLKKKAVRNV